MSSGEPLHSEHEVSSLLPLKRLGKAYACLTASLLSKGLTYSSSSDDTCVCILEKTSEAKSVIHFHERITADTRAHWGIHPIKALDSHRASLAGLIKRSLEFLPLSNEPKASLTIASELSGIQRQRQMPDFISVTRGPGMRSNLGVGLHTAKGLAIAWQIPVLGVHHMQAHLLTPGLVASLDNEPECSEAPKFPFLSLLVSGGHSMLIQSDNLTDHRILATTRDIAIGDVLDKVARAVLPPEILETAKTSMYAPLLEKFAFPNSNADYNYKVPASRGDEILSAPNEYGWELPIPFRNTAEMAFSFAGIESRTLTLLKQRTAALTVDERRAFSREVMRISFELLASRTIMALRLSRENDTDSRKIKTVVLSGGVAANQYLRHIMRSFLDIRGFEHVRLVAPPIKYCTDNAAMIAWAGMEMYQAGWESDLACAPIQPWSLDPEAADGGIFGVGGWIQRETGRMK